MEVAQAWLEQVLCGMVNVYVNVGFSNNSKIADVNVVMLKSPFFIHGQFAIESTVWKVVFFRFATVSHTFEPG